MNLIKIIGIFVEIEKEHKHDILQVYKQEHWISKNAIYGITLGYDLIEINGINMVSVVIYLNTKIGDIMIHFFGYKLTKRHGLENDGTGPKSLSGIDQGFNNEHQIKLEELKKYYFTREDEDVDLLS